MISATTTAASTSSSSGSSTSTSNNNTADLKTYVQEWLHLDTEIERLKGVVKQVESSKNKLSRDIIRIMKDQNIDVLNMQNDEEVVFESRVQTRNLSKKKLVQLISSYFQDRETDAVELTNFILQHRTTVTRESIRRNNGKSRRLNTSTSSNTSNDSGGSGGSVSSEDDGGGARSL